MKHMKELTINLIEEVLFWNHLIGDKKTNGEPIPDKMDEALTYAQQKLMFHLMDESIVRYANLKIFRIADLEEII